MTGSAPDIDTHRAPDIDAAGMRNSERIRTGSALPRRLVPPRAVVGWAAAALVVAAGGALAAVTFAAEPTGTVDEAAGPAATSTPPCVWLTQDDGPVVPAELFGAAPTPRSLLVFKQCDGTWTGDMVWMTAWTEDLASTTPGEAPTTQGDDGLPNPWEDADRRSRGHTIVPAAGSGVMTPDPAARTRGARNRLAPSWRCSLSWPPMRRLCTLVILP